MDKMSQFTKTLAEGVSRTGENMEAGAKAMSSRMEPGTHVGLRRQGRSGCRRPEGLSSEQPSDSAPGTGGLGGRGKDQGSPGSLGLGSKMEKPKRQARGRGDCTTVWRGGLGTEFALSKVTLATALLSWGVG